MVYGYLDRFALSINGRVRTKGSGLKLSSMMNGRLPAQSLKMLLKSHDAGNQTWAKMVENCLHRLVYGFVWLNGGDFEDSNFNERLKQRMEDCFIQKCHATNPGKDIKTFGTRLLYSTFVWMTLNFLDAKKMKR